ncbi:MAG: hypothetical protein KC619_03660 [Myxococcales bacterium]|nr:hypothetical protein [Myxococcales bacterium]
MLRRIRPTTRALPALLATCLTVACGGEAVPDGRFVRVEAPLSGGKVFSRYEVSPAPMEEAQSPGGFLARLWARLGPPPLEAGDALFGYAIEDRERGVRFFAYSAQSGPAYGADVDAARLRPSVEAFESWLARAEPAECEVIGPMETDYGGGSVRVGWRDGAAFEEEVDPLDPRGARSYEDCLSIATERGRRMHEDAAAGWLFSLEQVLPSRFVAAGRTYENVVTLGADARGLVLTVDEGRGLEDVHVADGAFVPAPDAVGRLWLQSFARWQRETR